MSSSGPRRGVAPLVAVGMAALLLLLRADHPPARSSRQFLDRLGARAEACLNSLLQDGRGAYLAELMHGAQTPAIDGVEIGSRAGDIVTLRTTEVGLRAFAAHPCVEQIEASRSMKFLSDVSTGSSIGVRGTGAADTYDYSGIAGENITIIIHGEGGVNTALTSINPSPANLVNGADAGPGNDALATATLDVTGTHTITVSGAAAYVMVIQSSRAISTGTLVGTGTAAGNGVFYLGTGATALRNSESVDGTGVAIGIIDTGIDITNPDFQNSATSTRILSIWDQTIGRAVGELSPVGFEYGAEYTQLQIDNHLNGSLANYVRHVDSSGHGTAMAGIAAGDGSNGGFVGAAPNAGLIVVRTFGTTASVLDALTYVHNKAESFNMPAVVALALGSQDGPHDGTSLLDKGLDTITGLGKLVVIVGAGNTGGAADKIHEQATFSVFTSKRIQYVPDPLATSSFAPADHVVISEIQAADSGGTASQQFVELYNPTDRAVDIGLWAIRVQGPDSTIFSPTINATIPLGTFIAPFSYYLIGTPSGVIPDLPVALNLFLGDGHVALIRNSTEIDVVGYGIADTPEATAAPGLGNGNSIERRPGATDPNGGNGTDQDDNGLDFLIRATPQPQNSQSASEIPKPPHVIDIWAAPGDHFAVKVDEAGGPFIVAADPGFTTTTTLFDISLPPNKIGVYTIENEVDAPANGATHVRVSLIHTAGPPALPANWGITLIRLPGTGSGVVDLYAGTDIGVFTTAFLAPNVDGSIPGTIGSPGTALNAITVGAYVSKFKWDSAAAVGQEQAAERPFMGDLLVSSSRGPTRDGRPGLTVAAPGSWIGTARSAGIVYPNSMIDAGNAQYVYWGVAPTVGGVSFSGGTSFAAAEVTGAVALILQKNAAVDFQGSMRNLLTASAVTDSKTFSLGALPNSSWGYGKMSGPSTSSLIPQATYILARNVSCPMVNLSASGEGSPTMSLLILTVVTALSLSIFRSHLHGSPRS